MFTEHYFADCRTVAEYHAKCRRIEKYLRGFSAAFLAGLTDEGTPTDPRWEDQQWKACKGGGRGKAGRPARDHLYA